MNDVTTPLTQNNPQVAAAPVAKSRLMRWVTMGAAAIGLLIGAMQLANAFILPGCGSSRSLDVIRQIFKDKNLPEPTLTEPRSIAGASKENTCEANYALPNEKGKLNYRVFWEGWTVKVMITKAG